LLETFQDEEKSPSRVYGLDNDADDLKAMSQVMMSGKRRENV